MRALQVASKVSDARAVSRRPAPAGEASPAERHQADRQSWLDRSPRVQRAVGAPTVQRQYVIDGKPIPNGPTAWILAAAAMKQKLKTRDRFSEKLLNTVVLGLQDVAKTRDLSQDDLEGVYLRAHKGIDEEIEARKHALVRCQEIASSEQNKAELEKILLGGSAETPLIFRGMTAKQALAVLAAGTLGGRARASVPREPPSEQEAQIQTGENRKDAGRGLLEEWSLGELTGFSTGGVMMAALAPRSGLRLPPEGSTAEKIGERGVTGWVDQPVERVAIRSIGNESMTDDFTAGVDGFQKAAAQKQIDLTRFL